MDDKKANMLSAIRLWALCNDMEEITDDESHRYWTDIAFRKGEEIIGFITEFDKDEKTLRSKMVFSRDFCHYVYVVTDNVRKRAEVLKKILPECGLFCYSNPYGLGMMYQVLKKPTKMA
jgi:hypothetical protein